MWRFLNSIPRAFRSHVHSPRPSAGLYVEEEQEQLDLFEKHIESATSRRNSVDALDNQNNAKILDRLIVTRQNDSEETRCCLYYGHNFKDGREGGREKWQSCQYDFWNLFRGAHHMLEAISLGSAMLWGSDSHKKRNRGRLLYRVLFATPSGETPFKSIREQAVSAQLAIKDAAGAARDAAINISKAETLDSALEEFQTMCTRYEAKQESLLGLEAAEKGDFSKAVEHLRCSCKMGNMSSCFNLGLCYETGSGVMQNIEKAKHYYSLAAEAGHSMALYNLGLLHLNCKGSDEGSDEARAAADCGCGCDRTKGLSLMEKSARLGQVQAQTYLGIHHIEETQDVGKAVPYFRAAADQNDCEAQYFLAICYEQGWGVEVNECRAAQLYSLAASGGHESAMYNLAVFNEYGLGGLPEDQAAAVELYQKAAELGNEQAKDRLQEMKKTQLTNQQWQDKVAYQKWSQQYQEDGREANTQKHASTLSPSASSPNLIEYLHKGITSLWVDQTAKDAWTSDSPDSSDPSSSGTDMSHTTEVIFHLAEAEGNLLDDSSGNQQLLEEDSFLNMNKRLHKSSTYPNFSLIACNT